ncbi:MAG TPA: sigma-54 dependent transcriptional regulator, partial [Kofleriaceae bacterium]|nr:sigma-54 dependent transcriptional regulator [Kofleriaceae bacterium]
MAGGATLDVVSIDDDPEVQAALGRLLKPHGCRVASFVDPLAALAHLEQGGADLVILDMSMPTMTGLEVLARIHEVAPEVPVIMLTGDATAQTAVQALKAGALNYLVKPLRDLEAAAHILRNAAGYGRMQRQLRALEKQAAEAASFEKLVGTSAVMREVFAIVDKIAELDVNVLILGESGTGKELVARAVHERSKRRGGPFVALNCAALLETLIDSELFGHMRGAFTGAVDSRAGAFERADGGTLFLDEIGDIAPAVQVRLLRVLQEREVTRVGGDKPRSIDVRVIAATLVDVEAAVAAGDFRTDLFYRLNVVSVPLPPLRQRPDDVPLLAAHFLDKHGRRLARPDLRFTVEAIDALSEYHWPGNVRELEYVVQRAIALASEGPIGLD